ncbi:MAG: helix-turn-helix transcriptional regulator [Actinomycetota bacterium]
MPSRSATPLEVHKVLADDTRYRLYRYLGLSGRPVSIRELSARLSLHPNTLRPHLRRLEEVGLVQREVRRGSSSVGRPQTLYTVVGGEHDGRRDYRLLAEILAAASTGKRARERAEALAVEWGRYLVGRGEPRPGTRRAGGRNLAVLQEAMATAGFDPRFRRAPGGEVEVSMRDCPFRELLEEHRDLVCGVHRGLLEGMLGALNPPHRLTDYAPLVERSICRMVARPLGG